MAPAAAAVVLDPEHNLDFDNMSYIYFVRHFTQVYGPVGGGALGVYQDNANRTWRQRNHEVIPRWRTITATNHERGFQDLLTLYFPSRSSPEQYLHHYGFASFRLMALHFLGQEFIEETVPGLLEAVADDAEQEQDQPLMRSYQSCRS